MNNGFPLTDEERAAARAIGFSERVCALIKDEAESAALDVMTREMPGTDGSGAVTLHAVVASAARERSEDALLGLRRELLPLGYLPFLIDRTYAFQERPDTIAVVHDTDPLAPVRFAATAAPNYDLPHEDVLNTLSEWRTRFEFDVLGAEHDSVYLRFQTLPADLPAFAVDLYAFCPDLIDQGIGCFLEEGTELLPEEQRLDIERRFAADTGDIEGRAQRVALQILAETIASTRRLTLWWD